MMYTYTYTYIHMNHSLVMVYYVNCSDAYYMLILYHADASLCAS